MFPDLHFPKDNRIILAIYAALTGLGGMIVMGWGPMWFGTAALARIFGAMLVATGGWAATLSQMDDPELRRKGVHWFAAGHCILLLVLRLQFAAMGRPDLYDVLSPEFLIVMLLLGHSESYFVDKNRLPKTTIGKIAATERLRTGYEQQIREAGAQEERNRLARDLHDSIKQQIFVIQTAAAARTSARAMIGQESVFAKCCT